MLGLVIAVVVTAASVHDNAIGAALLDKVAAANPSVSKAWTDAGFKNAVAVHGAGSRTGPSTLPPPCRHPQGGHHSWRVGWMTMSLTVTSAGWLRA